MSPRPELLRLAGELAAHLERVERERRGDARTFEQWLRALATEP